MSDLDGMLDLIVAVAEVESGASPEIVRARGGSLHAARLAKSRTKKSISWSQDEDDLLREWHGILPEEEISARLGRSTIAVHLRWSRDLRLPSPSKDPGYMTANRIARLLGVDAHKVIRWIDGGLLFGEVLPGSKEIRRVRKDILLRCLLNPANWIWFDPGKVANAGLRRMLARRAERWGDEWWTTSQVATFHGVTVKDVGRNIRLGKIQGVQAVNRGGRNNNGSWANWFVLRSEATKEGLKFRKGKGRHLDYGDEAEAFMLLARAVGCSSSAIGSMMRVNSQTVVNRMNGLSLVEMEMLNEKYGLDIHFRDSQVWADWRLHKERFPRLARAMGRFCMYLRGEYDYPKQKQYRALPGIPEVVSVVNAAAKFRELQALERYCRGRSMIKPEKLAGIIRDMDLMELFDDQKKA